MWYWSAADSVSSRPASANTMSTTVGLSAPAVWSPARAVVPARRRVPSGARWRTGRWSLPTGMSASTNTSDALAVGVGRQRGDVRSQCRCRRRRCRCRCCRRRCAGCRRPWLSVLLEQRRRRCLVRDRQLVTLVELPVFVTRERRDDVGLARSRSVVGVAPSLADGEVDAAVDHERRRRARDLASEFTPPTL